MKNKKLFSFLTSAVMAATCLGGGLSELTSRIHLVNEPLTAKATTYGEETKYGDYLYYETVDEDNDGTNDYVEISDCDESAVSVEIPAEIGGLPVTSIENRAFENCSSLASITIPDSVTSIGDYAFSDCRILAGIKIPDSVINIGINVFSYTALLDSQIGVKYADTWVVDCDEDVTAVEIKDGTRGIATQAFSYCESLSGITIPDSVINIGSYAFDNCSSLESITIPDSVTSIKEFTFEDCKNLVSITIPDSVTSIGESAFYGCTSLESITLPDSVTSIGYYAFFNCSSLASITIENPYCEIYDYDGTITNGTDDNYDFYFNGVIYGYTNSTAQDYAEEYGRKFVSLGEKPAGIKGDMNGDGKINVADVVLMQKYMVNIEVKFDSDASDINGDGKFNVFDVVLLKRMILNS